MLQDRSDRTKEILEGKFIRRALQDTAKTIDNIQSKNMAGFRQEFWNNRTFTISDGVLTHHHDKRQRFLDMRTRHSQNGTISRKKSRVVHNKIIFGTYNYLVRELSFGFTDAVKQELRSLND